MTTENDRRVFDPEDFFRREFADEKLEAEALHYWELLEDDLADRLDFVLRSDISLAKLAIEYALIASYRRQIIREGPVLNGLKHPLYTPLSAATSRAAALATKLGLETFPFG